MSDEPSTSDPKPPDPRVLEELDEHIRDARAAAEGALGIADTESSGDTESSSDTESSGDTGEAGSTDTDAGSVADSGEVTADQDDETTTGSGS